MNLKNTYHFEQPLGGRKHSVAGQRHGKRTRHPHTILGAIAPDAAPDASSQPPAPVQPPLPPRKPVADILSTALPAKESYEEAGIVARSAFQSHYTVPTQAANAVIYGSPSTGSPATSVVAAETQEAKYNVPAARTKKSTAVYVLTGIIAMLVVFSAVLVVLLINADKG